MHDEDGSNRAEAGDGRAEFLAEALAGLSRRHKRLPGKYLWDETGSRLYAAICETEDYYIARGEVALLRRHAEEIAAVIGPGATLVEFGSGASEKVRVLLDALADPRGYVAIDISREYLAAAAARIGRDYPAIEVRAVNADYMKPLTLPVVAGETVAGFFPGSTIGNFDAGGVVAFLERARAAMGPSWFLVGVDANRDEASLRRAYAGADGLMAALHLNVLARMNRELDAGFELYAFRHEARLSDDPARVEAHLVAARATAGRLGGREIALEAGESLHTDTSHKLSAAAFTALAERAGWRPERCWPDGEGRLALHLLRG